MFVIAELIDFSSIMLKKYAYITLYIIFLRDTFVLCVIKRSKTM